MSQGDLTTLANVKAWLGITNTAADALLLRLISANSRFLLGYMQRSSLTSQQVVERYDTFGHDFMLLRQWPATAIYSIEFAGRTITQQATGNPLQNGYFLEPADGGFGQQELKLFGSCFPYGRMSTQITYQAGYLMAEAATVPGGSPYTYTTNSTWLDDQGVTYASGGAALQLVSGAPAAGQYAISGNGPTPNNPTAPAQGIYTFNAADADAGVVVSYSFVPADIDEACVEMVGERYRYMDRIGIVSKSLGGQETMSFSQKDMSDYIQQLLRPYRRVTPA